MHLFVWSFPVIYCGGACTLVLTGPASLKRVCVHMTSTKLLCMLPLIPSSQHL